MSEFNFGKTIETTSDSNEKESPNLELQSKKKIISNEQMSINSENVQKEIEQARQDALEILNNDQVITEAKPNLEKKKHNSDWFLDMDPEKRVDTAFTLIDTKQKKLPDVVFAFLKHKDYAGLDDLEKILSKNYDDLVSKEVLKKI